MSVKPSVAVLALLGLVAACDSGSPGDRVVANAGDHEFTVQDVVDLLAGQQFPNEAEVVEAVAHLCVDYTLVALAAQADPQLDNVDLGPVLRPQFEAEIIQLYRDATVQVDTVLDDESLQALWDRAPLDHRVRARHILLSLPSQATPQQRDSVFDDMGAIIRRIEGGESFESVASEVSQDVGTRDQGGDLGWFGRGDMVKPFEEAAFALRLGELSPVVQTPFGLHLIRVDEREAPSFETARDDFRAQVIAERRRAADSTFLATAEADADASVMTGSADVLRELGNELWRPLNRRAAGRTLVDYSGGEITAGDVQEFIRTQGPEFAGQIQRAEDEPLEDLLLALARDRMLVERATADGIEVDSARRDSLITRTRTQLIGAADLLGIRTITPIENESPEGALDRTIHTIIRGVLEGTINEIPLGVVTSGLRSDYDGEVLTAGVLSALARLEEVRGVQGAPPLPTTTPPPEPAGELAAPAQDSASAAPDTTG